jgi:hypothetical protein
VENLHSACLAYYPVMSQAKRWNCCLCSCNLNFDMNCEVRGGSCSKTVALAAPFDTSQAGVWIRLEGRSTGAHRQVEWCIWANQEGECIPALPAAIAAAMLLADKIPKKGIVSPDWINRQHLINELSARAVNVAVRRNSREPWQPAGTA